MSGDAIRGLLTAAADASIASAAGLRSHGARAIDDTVERAALGGLSADGVGWAFACGYEAALARLDPPATRAGSLAALCATEEGGGHPRAIRTTLTPQNAGGRYELTGRKAWVTLGTEAEVLLVVATTGLDGEGRNRLRVARVPSTRAGVRIEAGGATPFAPEIGHARAAFDAVLVDEAELLPGDGYATVLKPFRTIEDTHVTAAVLGWGIGVGRRSAWERAWLDEAVVLVVALRSIGAAHPADPGVHIALAGALAATKRLLDAAAWDRVEPSVRAGWERDRPLLEVASTVRAARRESAWRTLRSSEGP
ncbi:MAG TPA: acyl-CoA dehydrogenase family protein [Polyangiaceae bacterium]